MINPRLVSSDAFASAGSSTSIYYRRHQSESLSRFQPLNHSAHASPSYDSRHPRHPIMIMASIDAVFSTEELLEEILQHVDMQTLLTSCQRVNTFWHSTINSSPSLQRALFFQPEASSTLHRTPRRMNSLLVMRFPLWFQGPDHPQDYIMKREKNGYSAFASLSLFKAGIRTADNPYLREGASWRRMLTAQPPVTVLGIMENSFHAMQFREQLSTRYYPVPKNPTTGSTAGMRMGEFYDLVLHHCATWEVSGFTVMQRIDQVSEDRFFRVSAMPEGFEAELAKLSDRGIQVLLQLFSTSGCFIGRVPKEKYSFWNRCGTKRLERK